MSNAFTVRCFKNTVIKDLILETNGATSLMYEDDGQEYVEDIYESAILIT
jgi:hypothetical protein